MMVGYFGRTQSWMHDNMALGKYNNTKLSHKAGTFYSNT